MRLSAALVFRNEMRKSTGLPAVKWNGDSRNFRRKATASIRDNSVDSVCCDRVRDHRRLFLIDQARLLFPAPKIFDKKTPADIGLRFEDLRIPLNARDYLHAWWIPAAMPSDQVILVFHGNGYVLEDMVEDETSSLHDIGTNLLLVDYRGYGSSTPIALNEMTVDEDAEASLDYLLRDRMVPVGNVIVLGRSIGSGPATYLAMNNRGLAGLILESPFSSIDDAANAFWYFRIYPASLILRTHFDNLTKISSVRVPLLVVSGTADTLTPPSMADRIFAQANPPKQRYSVVGAGHNDLLTTGGSALTLVLRQFVLGQR